jgi:hypothetical protein
MRMSYPYFHIMKGHFPRQFFTIGTVSSTSFYSAENGFAGLDSGRHWLIASVFGFMIVRYLLMCLFCETQSEFIH